MKSKGSLTRLICDRFGVESSSDDFYSVFAHTLSYLTRGIDYSEYQNRLKPFCRYSDFSAKDFRLSLHNTEYLSLRLRLFILRCGKNRSLTKDLAKQLAAEYDIRVADAKRIYAFWKEQRRFRARIRAEAKQYEIDTHLNPDVLRAALQAVMKPVSKYIRSYTYKKLRFICKSQNLDLSDLQAELTIHAVGAFYKIMPCRMEPQHVVNYIKRAVHNRGVNVIKENTSQKAGRLVNNDPTAEKRDSFSLLVVSENQMRITAESDPVSYEELAGHSPIDRVEVEHSVGTLVSTVKPGGKKHKFLTILMGVEDEEFTNWLREHRYCSAKETNSDYQLREDPVRFNILVGRFLRVNANQVTSFINKLRSGLDPENYPMSAAS